MDNLYQAAGRTTTPYMSSVRTRDHLQVERPSDPQLRRKIVPLKQEWSKIRKELGDNHTGEQARTSAVETQRFEPEQVQGVGSVGERETTGKIRWRPDRKKRWRTYKVRDVQRKGKASLGHTISAGSIYYVPSP